MGETKAKNHPPRRPSLSFVFVHFHGERRQSPEYYQTVPWWIRLRMLIEYYSIQWRWKIERRLARLFNRRWGG